MLEFTLSVMPADTDLNSAFAQLFEDQHSALVVERAEGDYRLVNFAHLTEALAHGASKLAEVHGQRLHRLERGPHVAYTSGLTRIDATVGLINVGEATALLYSVSEEVGKPLAAASTVVRCDRPGLQPGRTAQSWYHYYPPNTTQPPKPYPCVVKGCPGHVR